jgi:hypothetical protein
MIGVAGQSPAQAMSTKISSLLVPVSVLAFLSPKWSMAYLELPPSFAKSMALVSVLPKMT